eukprot:scaffold53048_cov60-Phaeocystis_antarctica.AAC.1
MGPPLPLAAPVSGTNWTGVGLAPLGRAPPPPPFIMEYAYMACCCAAALPPFAYEGIPPAAAAAAPGVAYWLGAML